MTDKNRLEEVREATAQSIFQRFTNGTKPWEKCTQRHKDIFLRRADLILSLKDKDGKPMLGIISDDQRLPKLTSLTGDAPLAEKAAYALGSCGMGEQVLASNFVKLIKEEE